MLGCHELHIEGYEEDLFFLLDLIGYTLTIEDYGEVSTAMHDRFDNDDPCRVTSCSSVSVLCTW